MENEIFKNINGYSLDNEQINAIKSKSKYTMIIAGAGSGKTLTMVGKIEYLLKIKNIKEEEILCISFTNETVNSLKEKIKYKNIDVYTFHKLAMQVLIKKDIDFLICDDNFLNETIDKFFKQSFIKTLKKSIRKIFKITKNISNSSNYTNIKNTIKRFINLYSANNMNKNEFKKLFVNNKDYSLLYIIYAALNYYEKEKELNNYYDFDDLIKIATKICLQEKIFSYKEIIIDEFQDTSLLRLDFIKAIMKFTNANLTVVGDDFQSIYRFSGCDLDIFLNFQENFPNTNICKIQNTYRNSEQLIKIAGNFVMKNEKQIKKNLHSCKTLNKPIKLIYYFNRYNALIKLLKKIPSNEILILGRNNFDIYKFVPKEKITWLENNYFKIDNLDVKLRYLTIHRSKGLESDNVILINLENNEYGFPSKKKNNKLISKIEKQDVFLFEEERRLMYVALTRTKNYCYLLVPYVNSSIFVKEIKKML